MHVKDPRAPPLEENKSSYRTYTAVGRVEEGAVYVQRSRGTMEGVLQQQRTLLLRADGRVSH